VASRTRGPVASGSEARSAMGMTVAVSWPYCNGRATPGKSGCWSGMGGPHGSGDGRQSGAVRKAACHTQF
jgi:hypothetical protein